MRHEAHRNEPGEDFNGLSARLRRDIVEAEGWLDWTITCVR